MLQASVQAGEYSVKECLFGVCLVRSRFQYRTEQRLVKATPRRYVSCKWKGAQTFYLFNRSEVTLGRLHYSGDICSFKGDLVKERKASIRCLYCVWAVI